MWIKFNNIMCLQLFMLFKTRVSKFWVMKTTNTYDFLHILSLIKIRPNMNFWREFDIFTYMSKYIFFLKFSQREWRKAYEQRLN
jgi:hypothetical protein